ncbi:MAG: extracellular solute-binding protein [Spirochaetales bacterium]|jgi:ABC-type glycerol-3-phosphate transport system substrate-binding protein|nr:extracellular solute-binding protein [Spirochaetales bacterium]
MKTMNKFAFTAIVGLLLVLFTGTVFAGGGGETAEERTELVLMHDKSGSPSWGPLFDEMSVASTEAVGVGFTNTSFPATDIYMSQIRSSLVTSEAPNFFTWWSTYRMKELADNDVLEDLGPLWDEHENEFGSDLRNAFTFDGTAYGFPISSEYWVVWYNKEVFKQYGLTEPDTWDEFLAICETFKANDVTPMMSTVEGRWPTFIMFEEMIVGEDPDLYVDLCEGRVKYSDPRVRKAFEKWGDLIRKGYFAEPGYDVWAGGARDFNQGDVGMALFGTWYFAATLTANGVDEDKIGAFILPSHNPAAGKNVILEITPMLVSKNAANLEDTLKVADYWMSPEGNAAFASALKSYPANPKSNADFLPEVKVEILQKISGENYRLINRYWEATPTPICEVAVDEFARFMINPDSLDDVLANLDKVADEYWSKN